MSLGTYYALPYEEQQLWAARWEVEAQTCRRHGGPKAECADRHKKWYPTRIVCHAAMEREAAAAKYRRLHEKAPWHDGTFTSWAEHPSDGHPYHFDHGVSIEVFATDVNPGDQFLKGN